MFPFAPSVAKFWYEQWDVKWTWMIGDKIAVTVGDLVLVLRAGQPNERVAKKHQVLIDIRKSKSPIVPGDNKPRLKDVADRPVSMLERPNLALVILPLTIFEARRYEQSIFSIALTNPNLGVFNARTLFG